MKKALKFISMLLVLLCATPMLNCRKSNNNNKKQEKTVSVLELQSSLLDGDWQFDVAQNDNGEYSFSYFPNSTDQYTFDFDKCIGTADANKNVKNVEVTFNNLYNIEALQSYQTLIDLYNRLEDQSIYLSEIKTVGCSYCAVNLEYVFADAAFLSLPYTEALTANAAMFSGTPIKYMYWTISSIVNTKSNSVVIKVEKTDGKTI